MKRTWTVNSNQSSIQWTHATGGTNTMTDTGTIIDREKDKDKLTDEEKDQDKLRNRGKDQDKSTETEPIRKA